MNNIRFLVRQVSTNKSNPDIINIALSTEAQCSGIKITNNSVDYLGKFGHQNVLRSSNNIIKLLERDWVYQDMHQVQYAFKRTLFFYLRFYLHYWLMYLYIIDQAIRKHSPEIIYVDKCSGTVELGTSISDDTCIFGKVVKQYIESNNLSIKIIEEQDIKYKPKPKTNKRKLFDVQYLLNRFMSVVFLINLHFIKNKEVLIVADDSYKMLSIIDKIKIKKSNIFPVYLNIGKGKFWRHIKNVLRGKEVFFLQSCHNKKLSSELREGLNSFSKSINQHTNVNKFNFLGVDLKNVLSAYIDKSINSEMALLENGIEQIKSTIDKIKPRLAISQHALGYSYALGEICSIGNIPSLLITHGTHAVQKKDKYAQIEWGEHAKTILNTHFSHTAIQSPMADEFFNSLDDKYSIDLKTGPLIYSRSKHDESLSKLKVRLIGKVNSDKKIIIHAGTPKGSNAIRPWVYETIDEYIRNINDLVDAVDSLKDVYLIVRFRPLDGLNKADFSKLIRSSNNCSVYSEGSFDDYLTVSDLLVSYSSTTIEEALQNDVAVLQYDHDDKYTHIQAPTVSEGQESDINPIYYCGNKEELKNSIDIILKNIDLIKSQKHKWDRYRYSIDKKLEWFDKLLSK